MYQLEDHYWWFIGRRRLALKLLRKFQRASKPELLDLGCGTGVILGELNQIGTSTIGLDMSAQALDYCRQRELGNLVKARGEYLPLKSKIVDGVVALDIFEHIDDHQSAYEEVFRVLKPGGILVLSVPAFGFLWGPHDVALHHFRRYTRKEVVERLEDAGFEVEKASYAVCFLFPIVALIRAFEKRKKNQAEASLPAVPEFLNRLLISLQDFEANVIQHVSLPWGSSVVAVGRKPELRSD